MAKKTEKVDYFEGVERKAFERHFIDGYFYDPKRFARDPDMAVKRPQIGVVCT